MPLERELGLAEKLVKEAGQIAKLSQKKLQVSYKAGGEGPVTDVEHLLDKLICQAISEQFPNDYLVSEESFKLAHVSQEHKRSWFIDPIDGTSSYIRDRDDYVIMIGLAIDGQAVLGAIYHPADDVLWSGINYMNTQLCYRSVGQERTTIVLEKRPHEPHPVIACSRTHPSRRQSLLNQLYVPKSIIRTSSVGLKAMLVVDTLADLYICWSKSVKLWDSCAATAITTAAQGNFTNLDGTAPVYSGSIAHGKVLIATNFCMSDEVNAQIKHLAQISLA
jgi:3'-phosphoadenosine 5'-phosphosulfate (PAPS) 3'-phosphatase